MKYTDDAYPIIGNLIEVIREEAVKRQKGDNYHPLFRGLRDLAGPPAGLNTGIYLCFKAHQPVLVISDIKVI